MKEVPVEVMEYYEHRIREAAQETGCSTLFEDADRLLHILGPEDGIEPRSILNGQVAFGSMAPTGAASCPDRPAFWPC